MLNIYVLVQAPNFIVILDCSSHPSDIRIVFKQANVSFVLPQNKEGVHTPLNTKSCILYCIYVNRSYKNDTLDL